MYSMFEQMNLCDAHDYMCLHVCVSPLNQKERVFCNCKIALNLLSQSIACLIPAVPKGLKKKNTIQRYVS